MTPMVFLNLSAAACRRRTLLFRLKSAGIALLWIGLFLVVLWAIGVVCPWCPLGSPLPFD